jgi:hypothetical protein
LEEGAAEVDSSSGPNRGRSYGTHVLREKLGMFEEAQAAAETANERVEFRMDQNFKSPQLDLVGGDSLTKKFQNLPATSIQARQGSLDSVTLGGRRRIPVCDEALAAKG